MNKQVDISIDDLAEPLTYPVEAFISPEYAKAERELLWPKVWQMAGRLEDIPEGGPTKLRLGTNELAVVRNGDAILAVHAQCAHAGGPLAEGSVVDGQIQCPWHGSRFRLENGHVSRGPAMYDQPAYEVRRAEAGGWEARRVFR